MKTLYLLRHAKAESGGKDLDDKDRPLSSRGREACVDMGDYIHKAGYTPSLVLFSPSMRTRETSERILKAAKLDVPQKSIDKLYLATADEILHYVRLVNDKISSAMVVGHNPGMHHVALMLASAERTVPRRTLELKYPTGSLAVLRFNVASWKDIAEDEGELIDFATPQGLNED